MSEPIRVLIVEDHDLFRTGLASYLGGQPDIEVVAQASGGRLGVQLALELGPDVVLMDLRLPDLDGTEATAEIMKARATKIVALTVASGDADIAAALKAGACAFLVKDSPIEDVAAAVRAAAAGVAWLSPRAAEAVLGQIRRQPLAADAGAAGVTELSAREVDVLRLLARGLENAEIAAELEISPSTAKNHVSSILAKLGLSNRIQAAIYAVRNDLE